MKYAKKVTETERVEAIAKLREIHPKGSTVFLILRRVSRSGMSRDIATIAFRENDVRHTAFLVGAALGLSRDEYNDHVTINGVGMDMGFKLVYDLSYVLYGDGYDLKHRWL